MKVNDIKFLVQNHSLDALHMAEDQIVEEQPTAFEVPGVDDGERLTHVMAAIWILHDMQTEQCDFRNSLRRYSERVRATIS